MPPVRLRRTPSIPEQRSHHRRCTSEHGVQRLARALRGAARRVRGEREGRDAQQPLDAARRQRGRLRAGERGRAAPGALVGERGRAARGRASSSSALCSMSSAAFISSVVGSCRLSGSDRLCTSCGRAQGRAVTAAQPESMAPSTCTHGSPGPHLAHPVLEQRPQV
jgi:hypothetical protein